MKTGLEKNFSKVSVAVANNEYSTKGISMPAVPALQKKGDEEEAPLQMMAGTVQMEDPGAEEEAPQTQALPTTTTPSTAAATSPAEIGAMAYTQGSNVNVASSPGGELPHEEEHPVQQKAFNPAAQLVR